MFALAFVVKILIKSEYIMVLPRGRDGGVISKSRTRGSWEAPLGASSTDPASPGQVFIIQDNWFEVGAGLCYLYSIFY